MTTTTQDHWRIIGAVARKDLLDALKNRMLLTIGLGVVITILTSQALPLLLSLQQAQTVYLYEPEGGSIAEALSVDESFRVRPLPSLEAVQSAVGGASGIVVGLMAPAKDISVIDAYLPYWVRPAARANSLRQIEERLRVEMGTAIELRPHAVYPSPDGTGRHFMASMVLLVVLMLMGIYLTPYLLLDERETRTMDALLVSPATPAQIVAGKALVGLIYCLLAATITLVVNLRLVTSGAVLTLGVLAGSLLFVSLGLLLGTLFHSMTSLNMAGSVLALPLLVATMLARLPHATLSPLVDGIIRWLPTTALMRVVDTALSGQTVAGGVWLDLGLVLIAALVVMSLIVWRMRRERQ